MVTLLYTTKMNMVSNRSEIFILQPCCNKVMSLIKVTVSLAL